MVLVLISCGEAEVNLHDSTNQLFAWSNDESYSQSQRLEYVKCLEILNAKIEDDSIRISNDLKIANRYWNLNMLKEFKNINNRIVQSSTLGSKMFKAKANLNLGDYYFAINNDSAYLYYKQSEVLLKKTRDIKNLSKAVISKGQIQYGFGEYFLAERSAVETLEYIKRCGDCSDELYRAYNLLGNIQMDIGDYNSSLYYHDKALKLFSTAKFKEPFFLREVTLFNIGLVNQYKGQNRTAIKYFNAVLSNKGLEKTYPKLYANAIDGLGYSELLMAGVKPTSSMKFEKALKINDSLNFFDRSAINRMHIATFHSLNKDSIMSRKILIRALNDSRKANSPETTISILKYLRRMAPGNRTYDKLYIAFMDSLRQNERNVREKFARIEYETKNAIAEKDIAIRQKSVVIICASIVIFLLLLLIFVKNHKNLQKQFKWEKEQTKANEEIYRLIMDQSDKSEQAKNFEKKRIARELHDGVINKLTSTRLNLHGLTINTEPTTARHYLQYIAQIQDAEKEIREIAHGLDNSRMVSEHNFENVIRDLICSQEGSLNYHFDYDHKISWSIYTANQKLHIYRIIQEAIQNAAKYSKCKNISINIVAESRKIKVTICDDGLGMDKANIQEGLGIKNMYARAAELKAELRIESKVKKGTLITLILNVHEENKNFDCR